MKAIVCEMCESTEFSKEEGMFICQGCGMRYSVEEVKKLMVEIEGVAPKTSNVAKSSQSEELENLYQIARRAKDSDDNESAAKYYDMILMKDPNSWEANFYAVYYREMGCKIGEIGSALSKIEKCVESTFKILVNHVKDGDERIAAIKEIHEKTTYIANLMDKAHERHYNNIDLSIRSRYKFERMAIMVAAATASSKPHFCIYELMADDEYVMINYGCKVLREFVGNRKEWTHYANAMAIINKYEKIIADKKREEEEAARRAQEERNQKYWEEHADERAKLESRKAELEAQLQPLNNEISDLEVQLKNVQKKAEAPVPAKAELEDIQKQKDSLSTQKSALGFFKGKEKKALQTQIDALEAQIPAISQKIKQQEQELKESVAAEAAPIVAKITTNSNMKRTLQKEIDEIKNKFTMNR